MTSFYDDACPFDWAEFNLPADLLTLEDRSMYVADPDLPERAFTTLVDGAAGEAAPGLGDC